MNAGPQFRIFFRLPKYLSRNGSRIAFTKKDVSGKIHYRIALAPAEINVRDLTRTVADIQQQRRDRVWDRGCFRPQDLISLDIHASYREAAGKFGCIANVDLIKQDRIGRGDMIIDPFLVFLKPIFGHVARFASICHDSYIALGADFLNKLQRRLIEIDILDPNLRRSQRTGDERGCDDPEDEQQRDLDPARLLNDIYPSRVDEDERDDQKEDPLDLFLTLA